MRARAMLGKLLAVVASAFALMVFSPLVAQAADPCSDPSYANSSSADPCAGQADVGTAIASTALALAPVAAAAAGALGQAGSAAAGAAGAAAPLPGTPKGGSGQPPNGRSKSSSGAPPLDGGGGQPVDGNGNTCTDGDPVDVVSGQVITNETDLELPGLLSLALRRAYASGYSRGRLFGPGWSSTLDQCVEIDAKEIRYVGEDAQVVAYPRPTQPGQRVLPNGGARWPLTWGPDDVIRIEDTEQGRTRHFPAAPDPARRPIGALSDRNGNYVTYQRSSNGLPTEVVHSGGYRVAVDTVVNQSWIRISGLRLLDGTDGGQGTLVRQFGYDARGRLTDIVNSAGVPFRYSYDFADRMTGWMDRLGYQYVYEYDDSGRVARGLGPGGCMNAQFSYNRLQRVTTVTDSLGQRTEFHYDRHMHVNKIVDPLGATVQAEMDRNSRPSLQIDELGAVTRCTYDENGDPVRIDRADGTSVFVLYNELRQPVRITGPDGTTWQYTYDQRGNLLSKTDPLGATTSYTYDQNGNLRTVSDAQGNVQRVQTDAAGLPVTLTDALGNSTRARRDAFGRALEITDALGNITAYRWTADGLRTECRNADGTVERWQYDAAGNEIAHTDEKGAQSTSTYGPFGVMTSQTSVDGVRYTLTHDTELRMAAVTGPTGLTWYYERDQAGRVVAEVDFNGSRQQYRLDAAGQMAERANAAGQGVRYVRDAHGRVVEARQNSGAVSQYAYSAAGHLIGARNADATIEYARDALGRVVSEMVNGARTQYEYDACGRRIKRTTPNGTASTWTYDAAGRPARLSTPVGWLTFEHDAVGRRTTQNLGNAAAIRQAFDAAHRMTEQGIWRSDATGITALRERGYDYRQDGVLAAIRDRQGGTRRFELDALGRVTGVQASGWSERYAYDALGNITEAANNNADDTQGTREHTGTLLRRAGRTGYEYDQQGRRIRAVRRTLSGQQQEWHYAWDAEDRLTHVRVPGGDTWQYRYDPLGRRIAKQRLNASGATIEQTTFAWDGSRLAEQVHTVPGGTPETITWDYDPDTYRPLVQLRRGKPVAKSTFALGATQDEIDERFYAIVTDLVGAPTELVGADGRIAASRRASLWGAAEGRGVGWEGETDCPLRFPGQYHDPETGLDYNYFRYYDAGAGRYLTGDPLGLQPAPNPHSYVINPLAWGDPLGLKPGSQAGQDGGHYGLMQPANPAGTPLGTYEINHVPAKDSWMQLGLTNKLSESAGPSIRMEYADHRDFISTGSSQDSKDWRAAQARLISQGRFDKAMKMDIDEIRDQFGTKYDDAIRQMVDDMPKNRGLRTFLRKNGWTINYCLLK
ncbi:DUF6531 domain-containing protein [Actinospica sp.]|uniref:DUF6531 domain-containing protein n=1 Tax=Actinospica sp. TaxID=1872142 RepID=UPI002BBD9E0C|nr:DUF6531 domain-containing protein [Actinospica sp.]HWG24950.1 DUF6531 domain-containing protein [Actinospica sp.]